MLQPKRLRESSRWSKRSEDRAGTRMIPDPVSNDIWPIPVV